MYDMPRLFAARVMDPVFSNASRRSALPGPKAIFFPATILSRGRMLDLIVARCGMAVGRLKAFVERCKSESGDGDPARWEVGGYEIDSTFPRNRLV